MASSSGIKIVMGGASPMFFSKPGADAPKTLSILQERGIKTIDTAKIYMDSEEILGDNNAGESFVIDTKIPGGFAAGSGTKDTVVKQGQDSLQKLKVKQIDILYIHSPDESVPFEDTLEGLNELHKAGAFRRLGLSNFKPEQVEEVVKISEAKGYLKPSVYQGNYNAFARSYEKSLLPLLRKHSMSFYAYSPQAGGFLSKSSELVASGKEGEGRIQGNDLLAQIYQTLYKKPKLLDGLTKWNEVAKDAGVSPADMAVRWVRFNSALKQESDDAIIIGGRTIEQIEHTLQALEQGPLSQDVVDRIDEVWETVKDDAPVDNYHDFMKKVSSES